MNRIRSSLTPRDRQRLLKEAADRARARAERPERQAANASRLEALLRQRPAAVPEIGMIASRVDPALARITNEQRTRAAVMDGWMTAHKAQLARD